MDFKSIFQQADRKYWWMDIIFYFTMSLLVATVLCYVIFWGKNGMQRSDIKKETLALATVGTDQQKEYEKQVMTYKSKIVDFATLFKNHQFASNVFAFMQNETMPNVWFKQFSLDEKGSQVQLSGEADDMDALSRQVGVFESNKYVKTLATLNSSLSSSAKIDFNINLVLDQSIFSYLSSADVRPVIVPAAAPVPVLDNAANKIGDIGVANGQKLITSFHILLDPEAVGVIDQDKNSIVINVPFGTDVKNLTPSIVFSPGTKIMPESNLAQDFSAPVVYTVIADDGSTQNYTAAVNVLPKTAPAPKKSESVGIFAILGIFVLLIVAGGAIGGFLFWRNMKNKKPAL